ncbi:MAG: RNA polymerase sigma-70 factor (family 1) [Flavobacteriales bacterium]
MEKKKEDNFSTLTASEFQQIFVDLFDSIRNFIYFKMGDSSVADDLAQDTFVKLWENRHRIDKKTVKPFLYTIAGNLSINLLKREQLRYKFINSKSREQDEHNPQFLLESKEYEEKLQKVIASMPEGCREVFLMNRIEDLKYREIAERLGLSIKAIEKRMSKALHIIRTELGIDI